jgi:hypothetical protein
MVFNFDMQRKRKREREKKNQNLLKYLHTWPTGIFRLSRIEPNTLQYTICVVWGRSFKTWYYFTYHLLQD